MNLPQFSLDVDKNLLCLGLDLAWHGGSKSNKQSQQDLIAWTRYSSGNVFLEAGYVRVDLSKNDRDPDAIATYSALTKLIKVDDVVVLAIDAPLQSNTTPKIGKKKAFRTCEKYLSEQRKSIDRIAGGSYGWHPNIQPGDSVPARAQNLMDKLSHGELPLALFTGDREVYHSDIYFECFPAEAIWAIKRQGLYPEILLASDVKSYKKQQGVQLTDAQLTSLTMNVLSGILGKLDQGGWSQILEQLLTQMRCDPVLRQNDSFKGGKLFDDVIDAALCLASAISFTSGTAHIWQKPGTTDDGHIIGPGLLTCFNQQT
ncbi:MAG: DUF429 domain-containing protein [Rubritalea sp.]|uniref:DUF429 domain-containing protein n=1 Tax=Rubritalea sp. TaxID=2109375 RepID=UPI003242DE5B